MKLIRAEFENFRLLRDLKLDFSIDNEEKLTVIRAENGTGKTTILNALQWGLYGDSALPRKGSGYRLSPIDWDPVNGQRIPISVQIEFEVDDIRETRTGRQVTDKKRYLIIRSVYETLNGTSHHRRDSTAKLFELTDAGGKPIDPPESHINEILPLELREVFFTDGDRAMSFISTKSEVKEAIQSLLGLGVIKKAIGHVRKTASELNKEVKQIGDSEELTRVATNIERIEREISELEEKKKDAIEQFQNFDLSCSKLDKEIEAALIMGDREELNYELKQTEGQLKQIQNQQTEASKMHSQLFESSSLSRDLLAPILEKSLGKLNELRNQGLLPSTSVPVLEERLKGDICICGESLDEHSSDGKQRRKHIQHLIEESREPDDFQKNLTDLYYESRSLQPKDTDDSEHWTTKYADIVKHRVELEDLHDKQGQILKSLEAQISRMPSTDVQKLRIQKQDRIKQRDQFNADRVKCETQLDMLNKEHRGLVATQNNLRTKQNKGTRTLTQLEVTRDIEQILKNSYDLITKEELTKVRESMNRLFLKMIRADPDQGAIIQRVEISEDFDILAYGLKEVPLDLKEDLFGASKRALTMAFILALAQVSEVQAPNVIDTPLGMMDISVKRSVLKTAISESPQLILFLTSSETANCENILDDYAGHVITLTNPRHYPEMLVNPPPTEELKVLKCECNHRQECEICMRKTDTKT